MKYTISPCDSTPPDTVRRGDDVLSRFISNPEEKAKENAPKYGTQRGGPRGSFLRSAQAGWGSACPNENEGLHSNERADDNVDGGDLRASNLPTYPCLLIKRAHAPCPDGQDTTRWLPGGCGLNVRSCEPISPLRIGSAGPRTQTLRSRFFRPPIVLGGGAEIGHRAEIGYVHNPREG